MKVTGLFVSSLAAPAVEMQRLMVVVAVAFDAILILLAAGFFLALWKRPQWFKPTPRTDAEKHESGMRLSKFALLVALAVFSVSLI
jgi:hypothetical protein